MNEGGQVIFKLIDILFPKGKVENIIIDIHVPVSIENKIRAEGINIIKTPYCKEL